MQPILPYMGIPYKLFVRPHPDYGDVIYEKPFNVSFSSKIKSVQYNAALAVTRAVKGSSCDKLYRELRLEDLQQRRWIRQLCLCYKSFSTEQPKRINNLLPQMKISHRHPNTFNVFHISRKRFFLRKS